MAQAVNDRTAAVAVMGTAWTLTDALMAGTAAMRTAGQKYLPKWPNEDQGSYDNRLATATLFPAFRRTVSVMAGKPFSKALTFSKETPEQIVKWCEDVDREGVNLHTFAADMMAEALAAGLCGILVEAPKAIETGARAPTRAEQQAAGIRPYMVRVKHGQILGWRTRRVNGVTTLTQLRLAETATVEDGQWGEKIVERVRVLTPGAWQVWEKSGGANGVAEVWSAVEQGASGLPVIPFVPLYGWRKGFMDGVSPLLDLAHLNVKHWQSQSDQDTILHAARVPILFAKMLGENEITVGAGVAVKANDEKADMKFVEHTGAAIEAGQKSLDALEDQMIQSGAELLVKKPGARSATESQNDAEANKSDLQRITETVEDALDQALQFMADYASLGTGGNVSLFKDFGAATLSDASAQLILSLQQGGLISKPTAISEFKRRGTLAPEVDAEQELDAVETEGEGMGTIGDDDEIVDDPNAKPTAASLLRKFKKWIADGGQGGSQ